MKDRLIKKESSENIELKRKNAEITKLKNKLADLERELSTIKAKLLNKILLVDDDVTFIEILKRSFEHQIEFRNYEFISAYNGYEAFEIFKRHRNEIKLIVTGLIMPRMSGMELIDSVHKIDHHLPILIVTGGGGSYFKLYHDNQNIITMLKPPSWPDMFKNAKILLNNDQTY